MSKPTMYIYLSLGQKELYPVCKMGWVCGSPGSGIFLWMNKWAWSSCFGLLMWAPLPSTSTTWRLLGAKAVEHIPETQDWEANWAVNKLLWDGARKVLLQRPLRWHRRYSARDRTGSALHSDRPLRGDPHTNLNRACLPRWARGSCGARPWGPSVGGFLWGSGSPPGTRRHLPAWAQWSAAAAAAAVRARGWRRTGTSAGAVGMSRPSSVETRGQGASGTAPASRRFK